MGCSKNFLQCCNIGYVVFFLIVSICQIIFGTLCYLLMIMTIKEITLDNNNLLIAPLILIFLGSIAFVLCLLGCCGFIKEVLFCINVYSLFFLLVAIIQIVNGAFTLWNFEQKSAQITNELNDTLSTAMTWYQQNQDEKMYLDSIQSMIECCGVLSPKDWQKTEKVLPPSCCGNEEFSSINCTTVYETGCLYKLEDIVHILNTILGSISISIGIVQFLVPLLDSVWVVTFINYTDL